MMMMMMMICILMADGVIVICACIVLQISRIADIVGKMAILKAW
jgi:hypothetical protein